MNSRNTKVILVPGAWMGGWIWEPTVQHLAKRDITAETLTLKGLEPGLSRDEIAAVHLDDHVEQLQAIVAASESPVVLVSHSYSSMVTSIVADRVGDDVAGLIHFGGFLPIDGRSLLDDWGSNEEERAQERADIEQAGNLWLAPDQSMLEFEPDLSPDDRKFLATRFTPHPGSTVTDATKLSAPIENHPATYVAQSLDGAEAAWQEAPPVAQNASNWRRKHISSGHWPMISNPEKTIDIIAEEVAHYSNR